MDLQGRITVPCLDMFSSVIPSYLGSNLRRHQTSVHLELQNGSRDDPNPLLG
jgi:hypothetical protein